MDEGDALSALERLGLTSYEAKVLVALQKLGTATASEIARVTDVPRSQVYGTADSLEAQGLVEVQNASPTRFRAVSPDEAVGRLFDQLHQQRDLASEYLRAIEGSLVDDANDRRPDIWVTRGTDSVTARIDELLESASERVVIGISDPSAVPTSTKSVLTALSGDGVAVYCASAHDEVIDEFDENAGIVPIVVPDEETPDIQTSRLLMIDDQTILISMVDPDVSGPPQETAMWSANTMFATLLVRLIDGWFGQYATVPSAD